MLRNPKTDQLLRFCAASLMTFALTACDLLGVDLATRPPTPLTKIQLVPTTVQVETMTCSDAPAVPAPGATQADVAVYVREVTAWGEECKSKLADVSEMLRPSQEEKPQ